MLDKILTIGEKLLEKHRVNPNDFLNKQQEKSEWKENEVTNKKTDIMEPTTKIADEQKSEFKQFDTNRIPESEYKRYGIKPENIKNEFKAMSYGYKSRTW